MLIKPDHPTTSVSPASTACVQCGAKELRLLHQVRHRGVFRRLCTTCVLRLHPQSFCPTCYQVYPPHPSNDAVLSCFKCYSSTHSQCVTSPAPTPYICTLCANPTGPIFKLKTAKDSNVVIGEGEGVECRVMDIDAAKKLLAAAKISAVSMNKAAVAAKAEAERRAKEAAFARKRAKEALEHVAYMVVKEKLRKKEVFGGTPGDVSGSGVRGGGGNGIPLVKRQNNVNVVNNGSSRNGIVSSIAGPSVVVEEKINAVGKMDRVENSNQVLAALNAVELRENEKISGIKATSVEMRVPLNDDRVSMMDVDESGRMGASNGLIIEKKNGDGIDHVMSNDMENGSENLDKQEDVNNEVVLASSVEDQVQYEEDNTGGEKQANGSPQ